MVQFPALPIIWAVTCLTSCTALQTHLDTSGIDDLVASLSVPRDDGAAPGSGSWGDPAALPAWLQTANAGAVRLPTHTAVGAAKPDWAVTLSDGTEIAPRILRLPSAVSRTDQGGSAVYYLYRRGPLRGGRTILWAPGMGVSKLALRFIRRFFIAALDRGWSVLMWVPPYHLERVAPGRDAGEGFFVPDPLADLRLISAGTQEIHTARAWLLRQGVQRVGAWGGSMGGAMLLLAAATTPFDHVAVMIPVLDWRTITVDQPRMKPVVAAWHRAGYTPELLRRAFSLISPMERPLLVPSARVQLLYAKLDQLTPEATSLAWAKRVSGPSGEVEVHGYDRSHATVLLTGAVYDDYARFLARMTPTPKAATLRPPNASSR